MLRYIFLVSLILFLAPIAIADEGYVSPESYAVNEADLTDYFNIPSAPRLNIDNLDKPLKPQKLTQTSGLSSKSQKSEKSEKVKRAKGEKKPYEERMIYKAAKWWRDQSYKHEDPSHGKKHEIKVKAREEYERQQAELDSKKKSENSY